VYAISGLPASKWTFFRGMAFDPPRAGMIAKHVVFTFQYLPSP